MNAILANTSTFDSSRRISWRGLLEFEKTLFVAVNMMDVLLTLILLKTGAFCESNPIAEFFLTQWGSIGMAGYKLVLVALILLIVNVVAIWQIQTSRRLLYFGSLMVGVVVAYSACLLIAFYHVA